MLPKRYKYDRAPIKSKHGFQWDVAEHTEWLMYARKSDWKALHKMQQQLDDLLDAGESRIQVFATAKRALHIKLQAAYRVDKVQRRALGYVSSYDEVAFSNRWTTLWSELTGVAIGAEALLYFLCHGDEEDVYQALFWHYTTAPGSAWDEVGAAKLALESADRVMEAGREYPSLAGMTLTHQILDELKASLLRPRQPRPLSA
jgi:hypothetical protein